MGNSTSYYSTTPPPDDLAVWSVFAPPGPTGPQGYIVNAPVGSYVLCYYVDQIQASTDATLSLISNYNYVYTSNTYYVTFSSPSAFIVQQNGAYEFEFQGWVAASSGNATIQMVVTRVVSFSNVVVFDRRKQLTYGVDGIFAGDFYWDAFEVGDSVELYKNENNTGTIISNDVESKQDDQQGYLKIFYAGPNYDTGSNIVAPTGPTGPAGGGGSSISIAGFTGYGAITTMATGGTGLFGNSNLVYNSNTNMLTAGALTLANGLRPLYQRVTSSSAVIPDTNAYGTHFDIITSGLSNLTVSLPAGVGGSNSPSNWSNDSNGFWVFRNNSGSYLNLTVGYSNGTANIYPSTIDIPPGNSTTLMVTYPGGGTNSNYILF
jgi:hypothetical protein